MIAPFMAIICSKDNYIGPPQAMGIPEGCEGGEGRDSGALGLGAAGHAEAGERGQQREGRQIGATPNALAVLKLQRGQARQCPQRLQPVADSASPTLCGVNYCPMPDTCCDDSIFQNALWGRPSIVCSLSAWEEKATINPRFAMIMQIIK